MLPSSAPMRAKVSCKSFLGISSQTLRKFAGVMASPTLARCSWSAGRNGMKRCSGRKLARVVVFIPVVASEPRSPGRGPGSSGAVLAITSSPGCVLPRCIFRRRTSRAFPGSRARPSWLRGRRLRADRFRGTPEEFGNHLSRQRILVGGLEAAVVLIKVFITLTSPPTDGERYDPSPSPGITALFFRLINRRTLRNYLRASKSISVDPAQSSTKSSQRN